MQGKIESKEIREKEEEFKGYLRRLLKIKTTVG